MTTEPMPDGYQVWGHGRSWVVEHYTLGQLTWQSQWFTYKEQADAEFREGLIALGWMPPEEARNMVDVDRVLAMMGADATLQELCDWLLELKR